MENVIVIGGGPSGLAASIYLARAGLKPVVFAGSPPGGQLMLTTDVENYPGYDSILGPELIAKYRHHAEKFNVRIFDKNVLDVQFSKNELTLKTLDSTFNAKSVLITTGAKALWLGIESEKRLQGKGVSACATCDGFFFRNKVVAVVGGGDTALEEALTLTRFASKVYVIHRRDSFRASKIMQERVLKNAKIEVIWNAAVEEVVGDAKVEGVRLRIANNDTKTISLEGLFIAIGHKPDTDLFKNKIELDEKGYVITFQRLAEDYLKGKRQVEQSKLTDFSKNKHYNSATSVEGVFAAGDCVDYQYRQAATAVGQGVGAALDIERWLAELGN